MSSRSIPAIIPARGGSQRIPNKNLARVGGHPLIAHTIAAARHARLITDVFVSTDSPAIGRVAEAYGAKVIERPDELATAASPTEPALIHAVEQIEWEQERHVDLIVLLQATSPLRRDFRIDQAVDLALRSACDAVVSVVPNIEYYFLGDLGAEGRFHVGYDPQDRLRTQDIPPRYRENGAIYVMTRQQLLGRGCRMGGDMRALVMDPSESIDIDDILDLQVCNLLMARRPSLAIEPPDALDQHLRLN